MVLGYYAPVSIHRHTQTFVNTNKEQQSIHHPSELKRSEIETLAPARSTQLKESRDASRAAVTFTWAVILVACRASVKYGSFLPS